MRVTVIARLDTVQMDEELERRMWMQLCGAFDCDVRYVDRDGSMEDLLAAAPLTRVFLEPTGTRAISEIPSVEVAIVVGNTERHNLQYALPHETYRIATPVPADLYGINAAAIALALRHGQ